MQLTGYLSKVLAKEYIHVPVLLTEVVNNLVTSTKGVYVDATYGRGGHSSRILGQLSAEAYVVAIDRDVSAIDSATRFSRSSGASFRSMVPATRFSRNAGQ